MLHNLLTALKDDSTSTSQHDQGRGAMFSQQSRPPMQERGVLDGELSAGRGVLLRARRDGRGFVGVVSRAKAAAAFGFNDETKNCGEERTPG